MEQGVQSPRLRIGVSSCLLGHLVRYDGGHKRHRTVTDTLSRLFEIVAVCPEMEVGMGVPREPVNLIGDPRAPRMFAEGSGKDWSAIMRRYGRRRAAEIEELEVSGFILKKGSPSCGPDRVPVHAGSGNASHTGSGLFAGALTEALPLLPVEAEDRLDDVSLCENFVERVHAYRDWRACTDGGTSLTGLMDFHASHKLALLAHSERHLRLLGRLLADARNDSTGGRHGPIRQRLHGGAETAGDAENQHQRAAAPGGLSLRPTRPRKPATARRTGRRLSPRTGAPVHTPGPHAPPRHRTSGRVRAAPELPPGTPDTAPSHCMTIPRPPTPSPSGRGLG